VTVGVCSLAMNLRLTPLSRILAGASTLALVSVACGDDSSEAGCTVDTDCKGERVCSPSGQCVDPVSSDDDDGGTGGTTGTGGSTPIDSTFPCGPPDGSAPVTGTTAPDTTPPNVTCIGFHADSYQAGGDGYIEFRATDDVSGIDPWVNNCWDVEAEDGQSNFNICGTVEALDSTLYRFKFTIDEFAPAGPHFLGRFRVEDVAGNKFYFRADADDTSYHVIDEPTAPMDIPVARMTIVP